jgi:hypothetical protein
VKHVRPDIGDAAMPLSCLENRDSDYTGVLMIASTWLILYGLIVASFAFTQATELLASVR